MKKLQENIILIIITSLLSFISTAYFFYKGNEIKSIDIHTSLESKYISTHDYRNDDLKILIKNIEKKTLGLLQITLLNYSTENYKNLNLRFLIKPKQGKTFKHISHYAFGEKGLQDLVKETNLIQISDELGSTDSYRFENGTHMFSYNLKTLNISQKNELGMGLKILYEGDLTSKDDFEVSVFIDGVSTREYEKENKPNYFKDTIYNTVVVLFVIVIAILILLTFIGVCKSIIFPNHEIKDRLNYAKRIYDAAKMENIHKLTNKQNLKRDIATILFRNSLVAWKNEYWIINKLFRFTKPNIEHFKID